VFVASPVSKTNLKQRAESSRERERKVPVPTETVADRRILDMGTKIEILNLGRAHTGGDLVVYLPRERILFASEVFSNRIFPSMASAFPTEWIQTLRKIERLDARIVVPGHGFVDDPGVLRTELVNFREAVAYVIGEVSSLRARGLGVEQAEKQANWGPYATWSVLDRNAPRAIQRIYDELDGKLK
jgi:cyclase